MLLRQTVAYFLFFLQLLHFVQPVYLSASNALIDPPELSNFDVPVSGHFKLIQKQWIRVTPGASEPKIQKFDLSPEALEKLLKKKHSKRHNSRLKSTILDFFVATSPKHKISTKFLKPRDWEDLQLFNAKKTLIEAISRNSLKSGEVYTAGLLTQRPPISSTLERRDFIASLVDRKELAKKIDSHLAVFAQQELNFFSDTMQSENEMVALATQSLKPGWIISKIPGATQNPNFLRFHALFTQKLAPLFLNPLSAEFFMGIVPILGSGLAWTIIKDFTNHTLQKMNEEGDSLANSFDMERAKPGETGGERLSAIAKTGAATGGSALFKLFDAARNQAFSTKDNYFVSEFLPLWRFGLRNGVKKQGTVLLCLLNDLFLWKTNDLRVALHNKKNIGKIIEAPKSLSSGPHYSLCANYQYKNNIFWGFVSKLLHDTFKSIFHEDVNVDGSPEITTFRDVLLHASKPTIGAEPVRIIQSVMKADSFVSVVPGISDAANHGYKKIPTLLSWLWGKAKSYVPKPAPVPLTIAEEFSRKVAIRKMNKLKEHFKKTHPPASKIQSTEKKLEKLRNNASVKEMFRGIVKLVDIKLKAKKPTEAPNIHSAAITLLTWFLFGYLLTIWYSRKDEKLVSVKTLDSIMFATAKPGMNLLSSVCAINQILDENAQHFPLPSSLHKKIESFKEACLKECPEVVALSKSDTFSKATGHRIRDHIGEVRRGYELLLEQKSRKLLVNALHIIAEIDCYLGIAKLSQEYSTETNEFCPIDFISSPTPFINAKNAWFPLLERTAIGSDLLMGDHHAPNILLTGMNGGGKSIQLKTVVFLLAFGHAFGFAPAHQCSMTPFSELNLHLNSLDNAAEGKSRWVAEAEAIVNMINTVDAVHSPGYFIYLSGDELGDGTAAEASIRVMTSLLTSVTRQKHVLSFIASHLQQLTELEGKLQRIFNFRISPNRKLEPGINKTNIAMTIFEKFSNTKQKVAGLAATLETHQPSSDSTVTMVR